MKRKCPGLILYHCLMAVSAEKNLYTLYLHANTEQVSNDGIDYFATSVDFATVKLDTIDAREFTIKDFRLPEISFGNTPVSIRLASMAVYTNNKWKEEAIFIQAEAVYKNRSGRDVSNNAIRIIAANRLTNK